jgi:hypothetical protein
MAEPKREVGKMHRYHTARRATVGPSEASTSR